MKLQRTALSIPTLAVLAVLCACGGKTAHGGSSGTTGGTGGGTTGASSGYLIQGVTFGLLPGTSVTLSNGSDTVSTSNAAWAFAQPVANGGSYNVIVGVQPVAQTCTVMQGSGTVSGATVTGVQVQCAPAPFTVGGTVTGLASNTYVSLLSNNSSVSSSNGSFVLNAGFTTGDSYGFTIWGQPAGQSCTISNGAGTVSDSNVTNVAVTCSAQTQAPLQFVTNQNALVEIGQPNFQSASSTLLRGANTVNAPLRFGTRCSHKPFGIPGGPLFIPDFWNFRVLVFNSVPAINFTSADWVIGLDDPHDFTDLGNGQVYPEAVGGTPEVLAMTNQQSYATIFTTNLVVRPPSLDYNTQVTTGKIDYTCSASGNQTYSDVRITQNILMSTDSGNHRLLLWTPLPTDPQTRVDANGVVGQPDLNTCNGTTVDAAHFANPGGFWTDDNHLIVADFGNNRVLIWNHPAWQITPLQGADVVLGAADFTTQGTAQPTATSFSATSVDSDGQKLVVTDQANHRVLIWNSIPTQNNQAFDVVLGQPDATSGNCNQSAVNGAAPTARTLCTPTGAHFAGDFLVVNDADNYRFVIYRGR